MIESVPYTEHSDKPVSVCCSFFLEIVDRSSMNQPTSGRGVTSETKVGRGSSSSRERGGGREGIFS